MALLYSLYCDKLENVTEKHLWDISEPTGSRAGETLPIPYTGRYIKSAPTLGVDLSLPPLCESSGLFISTRISSLDFPVILCILVVYLSGKKKNRTRGGQRPSRFVLDSASFCPVRLPKALIPVGSR